MWHYLKRLRVHTWFLQMCMYLLILMAMILNKEQKQDITQILAMAVHSSGRDSNQSSPFTIPEYISENEDENCYVPLFPCRICFQKYRSDRC